MSALDSLLRTAMLHHHSGRLDEAEAHCRRILKTAPKHPQTLHLLGMLHLKRGEPKKAIGALKRAIRV